MKTKVSTRTYCPCNYRWMNCYQLYNCYYKLMKWMRYKNCDVPVQGRRAR